MGSCWGSNSPANDLKERLIKANEAFQDNEAATSSANLLNSLVRALWPTLLAPLVMNELTREPLDLGKGAKGYKIRITHGTLVNMKVDCTSIGVVTDDTALLKPYYQRGVRTWTSYDVHLWLIAGEKENHGRWAKIGRMMVQKHFNGRRLLACTAEELQEEFNCTPQESLDIIQSRDVFMVSMADMAELIGTLQAGGRAPRVAKVKKNTLPDMNDFAEAVIETEEKKQQGSENTGLCPVASIDIDIHISGKPSIQLILENHKNMLLPNIETDVKTLNLKAKIRLELDPTNEEIRLSFFRRPSLELNMDIDLTHLHIPFFLESRWLPNILEFVLGKFTTSNPIKIPLVIEPPGVEDAKKEKLSVRSKRAVKLQKT